MRALTLLVLLVFVAGCMSQGTQTDRDDVGKDVEKTPTTAKAMATTTQPTLGLMPGDDMERSGIELPKEDERVLRSILNLEYKAKADYLKVVADFGKVEPFPTVLRGEQEAVCISPGRVWFCVLLRDDEGRLIVESPSVHHVETVYEEGTIRPHVQVRLILAEFCYLQLAQTISGNWEFPGSAPLGHGGTARIVEYSSSGICSRLSGMAQEPYRVCCWCQPQWAGDGGLHR